MRVNAGEGFEMSGCFEWSSVAIDPTRASAVSRRFDGCTSLVRQVGYGLTADC